MMILPASVKVFVHTQPTDMRCGFNKLSMLAEHVMRQDPLTGHLFVFFNKAGDKCKILWWDRTGFALWYKRLEEGTFERLPCPDQATSLEIDMAKLTWILEGIDLFKTRQRRRYDRKKTA